MRLASAASASTLDMLDCEYDDDVERNDARDGDASAEVNHSAPEAVQAATVLSPSSLLVHGAATGSSISRSMSKTRASTLRKPATSSRRGTQYGSVAGDTAAASSGITGAKERRNQELEELREQIAHWQREVEHMREEKQEMQAAFRRLDQEIGNGYSLLERKEKEMKIAELVAKNQKMAQILEKELKTQEALRAANTDLQKRIEQQQGQLTLVNQVLSGVETKHATLVDANRQLTSNHAMAQSQIATLQDEILQMRSRLVDVSSGQHQHFTDHEDKLRSWEARYANLQRKLDEKAQLLRAEQDRVKALRRELDRRLEEQASLVGEVADVHDRMIKMNGRMRTMEATVEAAKPAQNGSSATDMDRIQSLEEELVSKSRQLTHLMQTVDGMLSDRAPADTVTGTKRSRGIGTSTQSVQTLTKKICSLSQKLKEAESSRDQKKCSVDVLVKAFGHMLQQLDALQDKYHAAVESNAILSSAIDQMQQPDELEALPFGSRTTLARERYLLSGPYQPELLMGFTASQALKSITTHVPPPKKMKNFSPFEVRVITRGEEKNADEKSFVLVAEADDTNGVAFLNRSKINAFLQCLQGKGALKKLSSVVSKLAELLTKQRELMHQYSSDTAFYKAVVANLEREVVLLKHRLDKTLQDGKSHPCAITEQRGSRSQLLIKIVDFFAQFQLQKQTTFLTQPQEEISSDILITKTNSRRVDDYGVKVDLAGCGLQDDHIETLLLKIAVSGVQVRELRLDGNDLTDQGAATVGAFLEMCPPHFRIVSLMDNPRITSQGASQIRAAIIKNPRVHGVEVHSSGQILQGIAANEFESSDQPAVVIEVILPQLGDGEQDLDQDDESKVSSIIDHLHSLGLCDLSGPMRRMETPGKPRRTVHSSKKNVRSSATASWLTNQTTKKSQRDQTQSRKELKFRKMEAAIRQTEANSERKPETSSKPVSLAQLQYLLKNPYHISAHGASATSRRITKLQFAQTHLATIRGLQR